MLFDKLHHDTKIVHVVDNNAIDREVSSFRPDVVVIEAFWVVPEKFSVLAARHKNVVWIVRNHSPTPFAATEGIIFDWSLRYMDHPNVVISCNDDRAHREMRLLVKTRKPMWSEQDIDSRCVLLPNFYPLPRKIPFHKRGKNSIINIGCFGAVRPLKNQLIQAIAAIDYANNAGKTLRFHINGTRVEGKGEPVLRNLQKLFEFTPNHELVEHQWMTHSEFTNLLTEMDLGMQVSFTESFNIVSADLVSAGVPVVTSSEVRWVNGLFHADPNDSVDIARKIKRALFIHNHTARWINLNACGLTQHNREAIRRWGVYLYDVSEGFTPV